MNDDFDYNQMLNGELYLAQDIKPKNQSYLGKALVQKINSLPIEDSDEIVKLEKQLFGKTGKHIYVNPPLYVDYGKHINIGEHFYCNMDCIFLDVNYINIGNHVMVGPRVGFYTAGHPIDPEVRKTGLEFGLPITIEDNVWIGANAIILPGVTIGKNSIVGAGSVVTKNIPNDCIVAGNPARVVRKIDEKDKLVWDKKKAEYYRVKNCTIA